jgi:hypothetical protein
VPPLGLIALTGGRWPKGGRRATDNYKVITAGARLFEHKAVLNVSINWLERQLESATVIVWSGDALRGKI